MLSRPDIAQLTHVLHERIGKMKPHSNESPEMFDFRMKPWRELLAKLNAMFEEPRHD